MVWLWYPATPGPDASLGAYLPGQWGKVLERVRGPFLWQRFDSIRVHAVPEAPVSTAQPSYPVLIFSTGYGRLPTDYTVLAEDLASHGYVVAGIANTYSAPVVVFPDGRVVKRIREAALPEASPEAAKRAADRLVMVWAADVIFVMNQLENLNADPTNPFNGRLDVTRIGVFGHALGGAAAAEVCSRDTRAKAGLDIDGWLFGDVRKVGLKQPFMFIMSEPAAFPPLVPSVLRRFAERSEGAPVDVDRGIDSIYRNGEIQAGYHVTIRGARHFNFSDSAVLFSPIMKATGMLGPIEGARGLRITSDYVRAFFDKYLSNVDSPLLAGPSSAYPEVSLDSRAGPPAVAPAAGN